MTDEKRAYPRISFVEQVSLITPEEKKYASQSEDLSLSGMYLIKDDPFPPETRGLLSMIIRDGDAKKTIGCQFRVVHNQPASNGAAGMGIEFLNLDDEGAIAILKLLEQES